MVLAAPPRLLATSPTVLNGFADGARLRAHATPPHLTVASQPSGSPQQRIERHATL